MKDFEELDLKVKSWFSEAQNFIFKSLKNKINVSTKTDRTDLVTNVDKEVEKFYISKIKESYPDAKILGEESKKNISHQNEGLLFIIDPIDGTMNFVKQQDDFASMIAIYYNGKPVLGYILEVMKNKLYWGGPAFKKVFCNDIQLEQPQDKSLIEGLVQICFPFVLKNEFNAREIAAQSSGLRMYGSAGIEYIKVLEGKCVGYLSKLRTWDYAAGNILANTLGLSVVNIDENKNDVLSSKVVLISTKKTKNEILSIINDNLNS